MIIFVKFSLFWGRWLTFKLYVSLKVQCFVQQSVLLIFIFLAYLKIKNHNKFPFIFKRWLIDSLSLSKTIPYKVFASIFRLISTESPKWSIIIEKKIQQYTKQSKFYYRIIKEKWITERNKKCIGVKQIFVRSQSSPYTSSQSGIKNAQQYAQ